MSEFDGIFYIPHISTFTGTNIQTPPYASNALNRPDPFVFVNLLCDCFTLFTFVYGWYTPCDLLIRAFIPHQASLPHRLIMAAHSEIQQPALSNPPLKSVESSTRKLRNRVPKSYALPELIIDELDHFEKTSYILPVKKKKVATEISAENSFKPTGRLLISRQDRVSTPPPIPSCSLSYLQPDKFPAWLLGDSIVKSSPNYLSKQTQQSDPSSSQLSSKANRKGEDPIPFLPNMTSTPPNVLDRYSSSSNLQIKRNLVHRSVSPDQELETLREQFWEIYDYDTTAPHLQPKYFNKPLPSEEQWSDLDIRNVDILPDPIHGSPTIQLFEVFVPNVLDAVSDGTNDDEPQTVEIAGQERSEIPFGFHFLPSDYDGHQNQTKNPK